MKNFGLARSAWICVPVFLLCATDGFAQLPFAPAVNYLTGNGPVGMVTGDFNKDGIADLIAVNNVDSTFSYLQGVGNGTFQTAVVFATTGGPTLVAAGDFNRDGNLDIAIVHPGAPSTISIHLGDGHGSFTTTGSVQLTTGNNATGIVVSDFDADGNLDIAVGACIGSGTVFIHYGNGDGTFSALGQVPIGACSTSASNVMALAVGDLNKDGRPDILAATSGNSSVNIAVNNGGRSITLAGVIQVGAGSGTDAVIMGDFNRDGNMDFAAANFTLNNVTIFYGSGSVTAGSFTRGPDVAVGSSPVEILAADFNLDLFPDLMTVNAGSSSTSILLNDGTGHFSARVDLGAGNQPLHAAIRDFNGDARPDVAVTNNGSTSVSVLLSSTGCSFAVSPTSQSVGIAAGTSSFNISANGCSWTVISNSSFITITSGSSGFGNGAVTFSFTANNTGAQRTGTITAAGQTLTLTQTTSINPTCTYSISPVGETFPSSGGGGDTTVTTQPGCAWTAVTNSAFVLLTSGSSGTGSGVVTFTVVSNRNPSFRTGTLTVAGQNLTVSQLAGVARIAKVGTFRNGLWQVDVDGDGGVFQGNAGGDRSFFFGQAGDVVVVGDWTGDGHAKAGIFRNGLWALDINGDNQFEFGIDAQFYFGQAGDIPVVGDWNGDGRTKVGIFRNGLWALDINGNNQFEFGIDPQFYFGQSGDIPVVGDWDGDGRTKVGIFRNGLWAVDANGNYQFEYGIDPQFYFGQSGDIPVVGDWTGDGRAKVGIFRNNVGLWALDNGNFQFDPGVDFVFYYGQANDVPVVGDWNGDGRTKVGIFRNGLFVLDSNGSDNYEGSDRTALIGMGGDQMAVGPW